MKVFCIMLIEGFQEIRDETVITVQNALNVINDRTSFEEKVEAEIEKMNALKAADWKCEFDRKIWSMHLTEEELSSCNEISTHETNPEMGYVDTSVVQTPVTFNTFYVDAATGNDKNDGLTESTAYKTLKKACQNLVNGTTVYVKDGDYVNGNYQSGDNNLYPACSIQDLSLIHI